MYTSSKHPIDNPFDRVYLSLGSNLGDRLGVLQEAAQRLVEVLHASKVSVSAVYETEPRLDLDQPLFLNAVFACSTALAQNPERLLQRVLSVEQTLGRVRDPKRPKGPRLVDIDVLCIGSLQYRSPSLTLPHPALHLRRFVLAPLIDLAPNTLHPVLQETFQALHAACPDDGALSIVPNVTLFPR